MSDVEHLEGTLHPMICNEGESLEEMCERICEKNNYGELKYNKTWKSQLEDYGYRKYIFTNEGQLYEIKEIVEIDDYDGIYSSTYNDDGTIDFEVKFYNGWESFIDAIRHAL